MEEVGELGCCQASYGTLKSAWSRRVWLAPLCEGTPERADSNSFEGGGPISDCKEVETQPRDLRDQFGVRSVSGCGRPVRGWCAGRGPRQGCASREP